MGDPQGSPRVVLFFFLRPLIFFPLGDFLPHLPFSVFKDSEERELNLMKLERNNGNRRRVEQEKARALPGLQMQMRARGA